MLKFFLGVIAGISLLTLTTLYQPQGLLGASPSNGGLIGIYNATTTDMVLRDGYGSALAVDINGRLITASP